jgi:hypothetical protein
MKEFSVSNHVQDRFDIIAVDFLGTSCLAHRKSLRKDSDFDVRVYSTMRCPLVRYA